MARGITEINVVSGIGSTPARVSRKTGELQLNADTWSSIPENYRPHIIKHEKAHVVLNTANEFRCDQYSYHEAIDRGYSRRDAVRSLTDTLNPNNPEHVMRAYVQLQRALLDKYKNEGDNQAYLIYKKNKQGMYNGNTAQTLAARHLSVAWNGSTMQRPNGEIFDELLGNKKKKAEKWELKKDKKKAKINVKNSRADNNRSKADSRKVLADKGINMTTGLGELGSGIAGLFKKGGAAGVEEGGGGAALTEVQQLIAGIKPRTAPDISMPPATTQEQAAQYEYEQEQDTTKSGGASAGKKEDKKADDKKNNMLIMAVVAVVVVIVIAFMFSKNK